MAFDYDHFEKLVPPEVLQALVNGESYKVASGMTGVEHPTFKAVAEYFGEKLASRYLRDKSIRDGFTAMANLGIK